MSTVVENMSAVVSTVVGFEGTWNKNKKVEKMPLMEMSNRLDELYFAAPEPEQEQCPIMTLIDHFTGGALEGLFQSPSEVTPVQPMFPMFQMQGFNSLF